MPPFDLLIEKERVEKALEAAEDRKDLDAFSFWMAERERIQSIMELYPLG